jgi:hypothetical protein
MPYRVIGKIVDPRRANDFLAKSRAPARVA